MGKKDEESNNKVEKKPVIFNSNFLQVLLLSFAFMLIFTAFQTTEIIEETILQSIRNESYYCPVIIDVSTKIAHTTNCSDHERIYNFTGNGYTSLSILYVVFAFASWLAPSFVAIFHAKWSMVIAGCTYVLFIANFLYPITWLLYFLSALLGLGAAVHWTAQGQFLSQVTNPSTITRDSGIFWAINQCSFFFGNLLVYWQFQGKSTIDLYTRRVIFGSLTVVAIIGVFIITMIKDVRPAKKNLDESNENITPIANVETSNSNSNKRTHKLSPKLQTKENIKRKFSKALKAFIDSLKLFITPNMLLLSLTSIYTGLEWSFLSGIYSTSVGNTKMLGENHKTYVGLVGILLGIGEVVGGSLFGLLGSRTTKKGRTPIVFLGAVVHVLCFTLVYLNLPNEASLRETSAVSVFPTPIVSIALICAFLLGFGDACFQTQLISTFASVYKESSSQAFAIFKFTQSGASAISFYSSSYIGIVIQVATLITTCVISLITFGIVEWRTHKVEEKVQQQKQQQVMELTNETTNNSHNNPEIIITSNNGINKVSNNIIIPSTNIYNE